jgi:hypothetical protein
VFGCCLVTISAMFYVHLIGIILIRLLKISERKRWYLKLMSLESFWAPILSMRYVIFSLNLVTSESAINLLSAIGRAINAWSVDCQKLDTDARSTMNPLCDFQQFPFHLLNVVCVNYHKSRHLPSI